MAGTLDLVVSLRMRNFADLEARLQAGQRVSKAEMEAKYLPFPADYERAASWLESQGFASNLQDKNHTNIFVRGSVARCSEALGVTFARVATRDGEFSSAVTAPSLPEDISGVVLGITGLQPHILMHSPRIQSTDGTGVDGRFTPADILFAYDTPISNDAHGVPITGSGQTIAIIMDAAPLTTDLTAFWQAAGVSDSLNSYTLVNVAGGPTATSQTNAASEVTLDAEWSSGIAPGANIRIYAIPELNLSDIIAACTVIMNDGLATVVSYSGSGVETDYNSSSLEADSQTFAQMTVAGITFIACSGDGGSNPNSSSEANGYSTSNALSAEYPASDPYVTGVGGTTVTFDVNWNATSETAWSQIGDIATNPLASGGGTSAYFSRPAWQIGTGVPQGAKRCVPDVAAVAQGNPLAGGFTGAFVVSNGVQTGLVGTSVSAPVWAGVCAMLNQYRVSVGLPTVGLLSRATYPLIGTTGVNDVTTGSNGAYAAGPGYDLCTGTGSPNIKEITDVPAPTNPVSAGSPVTMSVTAQFLPSTYQWQLNGVNISGATGNVYYIPSASVANDGAYAVVITNSQLGTLQYNLGTLSVSAPATTQDSARLINISTRAQVGTGANILIPGFVITGSGTETLLIRGDGPSLSQFGVAGVLAQPTLSVYNGSTLIAANSGWGTSASPEQISATAAQVGAFAFTAGSADCALIVNLTAGSYTVQISGLNNSTGVALAEVYEVSSTGTRLVNISTRAMVGTGGNILIPGFVISGQGTEELLVRADGPSLTQFSVSGVLAQTTLGIYNGATLIASNTGWGTSASAVQIAAVAAQVGAFAFSTDSGDSAQIVNLAAGGYTIQISGVSNTTGVALAEVYEVPPVP